MFDLSHDSKQTGTDAVKVQSFFLFIIYRRARFEHDTWSFSSASNINRIRQKEKRKHVVRHMRVIWNGTRQKNTIPSSSLNSDTQTPELHIGLKRNVLHSHGASAHSMLLVFLVS